MSLGIIYIATNIKTNKSYVGQTTKTLKLRKSEHMKAGKHYRSKFYNAINKYHANCWTWSIIQDGIPHKFLDDMEIFYIHLHDTFKNGYNSTSGGKQNTIVDEKVKERISVKNKGKKKSYMIKLNKEIKSGIKLSKEHKNKISKSLAGKIRSEETKNKMSLSQTGRYIYEEHRNKLSIAMSGKKRPEQAERMIGNNIRSKKFKIICPDGKSEIITNLSKYCKDNGLVRQHMSAVARGKRTHHKRYKCEYLD